MCGIAGFVGAGDADDLRRMAEAMVHRGPDDEGFWHDGRMGLYLAHRRLAVLDIEGGAQPMWSQDGAVGVVFNGEIYNHAELRRDLEKCGHFFLSDHSDTEVLIHGYRQWGPSFVERLNGMWALALYDRQDNRLLLSRDRFGKKPLYYTASSDLFAFASELTALLQHRHVKKSLSPLSLKKYFAYGYIPEPHSLYERILKLPSGSNLMIDLSTLRLQIRKYWQFRIEPFERIPKNAEEAWGEQIRELLGRAVRRRLVADVPVGVFLSGGIDSSTVTALAAEAQGADRLKTFSIGFAEKSFDESVAAQRAAALFGTEHSSRRLSMQRAAGLMPVIAARLDEPLGDSSILPTYLLCRETRKRVTVALGGDGGDELFAGYDPFRALRAAAVYARLVPRPVHRGVLLAASLLPVSHRNISYDFKLKQTLRGLSYPQRLWNPVWMGPLSPAELRDLFDEPVDVESVYSEAIDCWDRCRGAHLVDRTLMFFTELYLKNDILVKVDRSSMMHSLEVRSPFLDIELVDFVRRIPHVYKLRGGNTKYIFKKALAPLLPPEIRNRKKKGFGAPVGEWLRKGRLTWTDSPSLGPGFERFSRRYRREHTAGRADYRLFLFNGWLLGHYMAARSATSRLT
jgi:asparagine synthase (glutamine-hydrolysing)